MRLGDRFATPDVLGVGHRLKMCRVNAKFDAAEVVKFQTGGDFAMSLCPSPAVCSPPSALKFELPVAPTVLASAPKPARTQVGPRLRGRSVFVDLRPEPFSYRRLRHLDHLL